MNQLTYSILMPQGGMKIYPLLLMNKKYQTQQIADFVGSVSYEYLDASIVLQLKRHLLDAIASLIQAQSSETVHKLIGYFNDLGTGGPCSVPVLGTLPI
ncbi:MAG TPA: hypothetical protein VIL90_07710, partial [Puia sp.]